MNDNAFPAESLVIETIRHIEESVSDPKGCWRITMESADTLHFFGDHSIDGLIETLSSLDQKVVALAILYLGLLNSMGINAGRAIEPIRQATARNNSDIVVLSSGISLAMLGHSDAVLSMA